MRLPFGESLCALPPGPLPAAEVLVQRLRQGHGGPASASGDALLDTLSPPHPSTQPELSRSVRNACRATAALSAGIIRSLRARRESLPALLNASLKGWTVAERRLEEASLDVRESLDRELVAIVMREFLAFEAQRDFTAAQLLVRQARLLTHAAAEALAHRLRCFAARVKSETASEVWLQGLSRYATLTQRACISPIVHVHTCVCVHADIFYRYRSDAEFQRCAAGVAAKADAEFFKESPYSGYNVVDVMKLNNARLRCNFLAEARAESEASKGGVLVKGQESDTAGPKVKGLFCHISVASVEHVALLGFAEQSVASCRQGHDSKLVPEFGAKSLEHDFAGAGAWDGDVMEELSSCVFRKRWCIGEELLQSHARIQAMLSASHPPPLPIQFSRHSTLQAQQASLHQTPDIAHSRHSQPRARGAATRATGSYAEEGAQTSARGREGLRKGEADKEKELVKCLVLCRVILPGARAELRRIIDDFGQVAISEPSKILPEFFIFYTLNRRSDSDDEPLSEDEAQHLAPAAAAFQKPPLGVLHPALPVQHEHRPVQRVVLAPGGLRKPRPVSVVT